MLDSDIDHKHAFAPILFPKTEVCDLYKHFETSESQKHRIHRACCSSAEISKYHCWQTHCAAISGEARLHFRHCRQNRQQTAAKEVLR